jgi:hypothetical protein
LPCRILAIATRVAVFYEYIDETPPAPPVTSLPLVAS